jgi:hypothetical protein
MIEKCVCEDKARVVARTARIFKQFLNTPLSQIAQDVYCTLSVQYSAPNLSGTVPYLPGRKIDSDVVFCKE